MASLRSWFGVILACFFLLPVAYSIEVGFSAENCGESVGLISSYEVDPDVSVREESSASFDPIRIENTRSISGTGNINARQFYYGSADYNGHSYILAQDASIEISTSACLTPRILVAKLIGSIDGTTGSLGMDLTTQRNNVNTDTWVSGGSLRTNLAADTSSVGVSQIADIDAEKGCVSSSADWWQLDRKQNHAETSTRFENGILHAVQSANSNYIARLSQVSDVNAELAIARSDAGQLTEDASTNYATTYTQINNGELKTKHTAKDDGTASVFQVSNADAEYGSAETHAGYASINSANNPPMFAHSINSEAKMSNGGMIISQSAVDDNGVAAAQEANINAESAVVSSNVRDSAGKYATAYSSMTQGALITRQISKNDGMISVSQISDINAYIGTASSYITDERNNLVGTWCDVYQGSLSVAGLKATNDGRTLQASGETSIVPNGIGSSGMAFAYANFAQSFLDVSYGSSLHAAMRSELNEDMPYAEAMPL